MKAVLDEFKPIEGFPGYAVSASGEVISFKRGKCRVLKQHHTRDGYQIIPIHRDNTRHTPTVHSLVATAFLGPRPTGYDIDHKDGDKTNNHYTNLRYVTTKENINNPNTLPNNSGYRQRRGVVAIKDGVECSFDSIDAMCRVLGLKHSCVSYCLSSERGQTHHHGYTFRYKEAQ